MVTPRTRPVTSKTPGLTDVISIEAFLNLQEEEEEGEGGECERKRGSSLMLGKPLNLQDHALIMQPLCGILDRLPLELFSLTSSPVEKEEEERSGQRRKRSKTRQK